MPDVWITTGEAAAMLGVSIYRLRKWAKKWGFTVRRCPNGYRYFKLSEILKAGGSYELLKLAKEEQRRRRIEKAVERLKQEIEEKRKKQAILKGSHYNI